MKQLVISNLVVSYDAPVLHNLSLALDAGGIHGIAGLNGSGKTTLLNTIYGLKQPDSGTVTFGDMPVSNEQIGFLETSNFFYSRITGGEYLDLFRLANPAFDVAGWNELFELPLKQLIDGYSTGMKKKLALLGALCLNRDIIMLDEPFNGLDLDASQKLRLIIDKLGKTGKTVLLTSHILETLTNVCTTISYLENGEIRETYQPTDFPRLASELHELTKAQSEARIDALLG